MIVLIVIAQQELSPGLATNAAVLITMAVAVAAQTFFAVVLLKTNIAGLIL